MACVNDDGSVSAVGRKVLASLEGGATVSDAARVAALPLYRVRASLRELAGAGLAEEMGDERYALTAAGRQRLATPGEGP